jgi:hypothetical protein
MAMDIFTVRGSLLFAHLSTDSPSMANCKFCLVDLRPVERFYCSLASASAQSRFDVVRLNLTWTMDPMDVDVALNLL